MGVRDQRDQWHGAKYRYARKAEGTIKTREMGCCLSGNILLRGGFAPSMLSSLRCSERNARVKGVVV